MGENSENKEINNKTSFLRPPTKIPTMGVSRLPSSSSIKLDEVKSESTVTKLDGGSTANKVADMPYVSKHNGFNIKTVDDRKLSSSSDSFMGDARRLSEAGVRRSSGNSVVLTEDTDKFIIGNRIWVGGTKPGQIAYIGETNFGNGDWAGVVLDEPIGKNDGSVGGTRYFQCEPKKGIFARLTNLTYTPLKSVEDTMVNSSFSTVKPLGFSTPMPKRQASTVTATKTSTKSISQTPVSKSSSDLKIGDRVIISSSQGSKLGVLRYRGATQFAPGEWCGIELDDPLGKNNGTVEGIKYFDCEDKFGLFTPVNKVSKSPMSASRMSTNCAIHKVKRSPESMNGSMISAITSNTMSSIPSRVKKVSDLDRLNSQLTQMKKENELLRLQVTKAANQADIAERRLEETLKAQIDKTSDTQVNDIIILKNQLDYVKKQMEEEKEKLQNLQFTNEEQNVVNIELQNKNSELLIKIHELEIELDKERDIAKDVERETMKNFEKEEELCRVKEELESLKKVIDNNEDELQKSVSNLSSEVVDKEVILNTLRQTLNDNSQMHDRLLKEANEKFYATTEHLNKLIQEKDKKIEQNQEMIDQLNEGIKCLSALKNEEHDSIVNNLKNELSKLKDEYKATIEKKEQETKISIENHTQVVDKLKQELKYLTENVEISLNDKIKANEDEIKVLLEKLNTVTNDFEQLKKVNQNVDLELQLAFKSIQDKTTLITNLEKKYNDLELQQDLNRNELEKEFTTKLKYVNDELVLLKLEKSNLEEKYDNYVKDKVNKTKNMDNKLQQNNILIENLNKSLKELDLSKQNEIDSMSKQISQLQEEREQLLKHQKLELSKNEEIINTLSNKLEEMLTEKQKQDLSNANLQTELTNESNKYETTIKYLQNKIDELEVKLVSKQEEFKKELQLSNNEKESIKLENINLVDKFKSLEDAKIYLEEKLMSNEVYKQDIQNLNEALKENQNIIDNYQIKIKQFDELILQTKNDYETILKEKEEEINKLILSLENNDESILDEKVKENVLLRQQIKNLENMKIEHDKQLEERKLQEQNLIKLNETIQEKNKIIEDKNLQIKQFDSLVLLTKNEFETKLLDKENKINELSKIGEEKLNSQIKQMENQTKAMLDEKDKENSNLLKKINILENSKVSLEEQLKITKTQTIMITELKRSIEEKTNIINDNSLKIEELSNTIKNKKEEFNIKLKEKDEKIKECKEIEDERLKVEKMQTLLLNEKDKENKNLLEKLSLLENTKLILEGQLENSKKLEHDIIEFKKIIEEKNKIIEDNNSKIELLSKLSMQSKDDFDAKLKEREKKIDELIKNGGNKLEIRKIEFEKCLNEKDTEINVLKNKLQEFEENNREKELMLKLETVIQKLEKEKIQVSNLEKLKNELEKTVLEYKSELELLEASKIEMAKTVEEQLGVNAELVAKINADSEKINDEKVQKIITELKIKCSILQCALNENNCEIEHIKSETSKKKNIDSEELNRFKVLHEKDRSIQSHLEFRIQELTDENHRLNEHIERASISIQKDHDIIQEYNNIKKKYEETYSMLKIKENQILVLQTELNSWKLKDMGKSENTQETTDKTEAHLLAEKNEEIKLLNSIIVGLHKKLSAVMETDVDEFEIEKNPDGVTREDYRKLYKTSKNNIKLKECENLSLKQDIYKLKTENDRYSEFKTKCEKLENENKTLQKLVVNYESSSLDNVKNGKDDIKSETEKILEEKDWQINLLNNIIADLHSKVSDNKFKIEALEKQLLDSGVDQNKKVRLRTTRLYCELCEIFDSHDTEDCPEKPESPKFQKKRRVVNDNANKMTEEPFCVCCDMFGHTAEDCDSTQTF